MTDIALNTPLFDFLEAMNRTATFDDAWESTVTFMRGLGATHAGILLTLDGSDPVYQTSAPPWVGEMYQEKVYPSYDPKLEHCRNNVRPYLFGKEFWHLDPDTPVIRRRFDEELVSVGMRSAVAGPIHMPACGSWGYVSFFIDTSSDEFNRFYKDYGAMIYLGAITAFNRIHALVSQERAGHIGLTEQERRCLLWLAKGLRNDRIAERMNLSKVTVEFHLANARRKLDARTRGQALVKAVQLGLIEP